MAWSMANILAFLTLLITIPTSILGMWTLFKGRQRYQQSQSAPYIIDGARDQLLSPPSDSSPTSHLPLLPYSRSRSQSLESLAEAGLLSYYYMIQFGSLEVRQR
ncbi:hypothetical protein BJX99DRAFT_219621 [Aspergillus californicus]